MRKSRNTNILLQLIIFVILTAVLVKFAVYAGIAFAVFLAFKIVFLK